MSILFATSELDPTAVSSTTNITGDTTAGEFDSTYARACMKCIQNATVTIDFTASSEVWIHLVMSHDAPAQTGFFVRVGDSATVPLFELDGDSIDNWDLALWTGFGWDEVTSPNINVGGNKTDANYFPNTHLTTIDIHISMANSGGILNLYFGGVLAQSFTGDTLRTAATTVDQVVFANGVAGTSAAYISEIIVADEDTRDMRVATLAPNANATNTAWTGDFTDIDETALNDTDLISSNTNADLETYDHTALPTDDYDVAAVVVGFRGQDDASGVQQVAGHLRSNTTENSGATQAMPAAFSGFYEVWETDPDTAAAWAKAAVDAAEIGVEALT